MTTVLPDCGGMSSAVQGISHLGYVELGSGLYLAFHTHVETMAQPKGNGTATVECAPGVSPSPEPHWSDHDRWVGAGGVRRRGGHWAQGPPPEVPCRQEESASAAAADAAWHDSGASGRPRQTHPLKGRGARSRARLNHTHRVG